MGHHYTPSPPSMPSFPVPPPYKSPPVPIPTPPHIVNKFPSDQNIAPAPSPVPASQGTASGGNGMVYCSGPQAPGWNVSTGKCTPISTSTNAIVPQETKPTVIKLSQLPYTGNATSDIMASFLFYLAITLTALILFTALYIKTFYVRVNS